MHTSWLTSVSTVGLLQELNCYELKALVTIEIEIATCLKFFRNVVFFVHYAGFLMLS